jgi:hypothetical protein
LKTPTGLSVHILAIASVKSSINNMLLRVSAPNACILPVEIELLTIEFRTRSVLVSGERPQTVPNLKEVIFFPLLSIISPFTSKGVPWLSVALKATLEEISVSKSPPSGKN